MHFLLAPTRETKIDSKGNSFNGEHRRFVRAMAFPVASAPPGSPHVYALSQGTFHLRRLRQFRGLAQSACRGTAKRNRPFLEARFSKGTSREPPFVTADVFESNHHFFTEAKFYKINGLCGSRLSGAPHKFVPHKSGANLELFDYI